MNKNKKIFITIIIIFSIIYLLIIKKNNKKYEVVPNKIKTYDYNEWIKLNTNSYLKRDASFYFVHQFKHKHLLFVRLCPLLFYFRVGIGHIVGKTVATIIRMVFHALPDTTASKGLPPTQHVPQDTIARMRP